MVLRRMVVDAVLVEGRSVREVATAFGRSKSWVHDLVTRYRLEGDAALTERSRRPVHSPRRTSEAVEEAIVRLRKELCDLGADAGPQTIAWHLEQLEGRRPRRRPSIGSWPVGASSPRNRGSGPRAPSSGSKRISPTSAGRET